MQDSILKDLLERYVSGELAADEKARLITFIDDPSMRPKLEEFMKEAFEQNRFLVDEDPNLRSSIHSWLKQRIADQKPARVFSIGRWIAAASILLFLGAGGYFLLSHKKHKQVIALAPALPIKAPGQVRATITLANGQQVFLDDVENGTVAMEGSVEVVKLPDGTLAYNGSSGQVIYNTLSNPKGSKVVSLTLSDGTKLVLDAGSTIRYPVSFAGHERKVELTGQGWFAVVHNERMPFKVMTKGVEIIDLGTEFNVQAFEDESTVSTTLIDGSVQINASGKNVTITPGQQGIVLNQSIQVQSANLTDVLAWKNGFFSFRHSGTRQIMRELSRWYDVEVRYEKMEVEEQYFTGKIDRSLTLNEVLKILEQTQVSFRIEGDKKIIILK
jgi:ferric-dicitrate binding protein FerR (iron transport regulator)